MASASEIDSLSNKVILSSGQDNVDGEVNSLVVAMFSDGYELIPWDVLEGRLGTEVSRVYALTTIGAKSTTEAFMGLGSSVTSGLLDSVPLVV